MSVDLAKLTPAPWVFGVCGSHEGLVCLDDNNVRPVLAGKDDDLKFAALARNAFDVMMRRHLEPEIWFAESEKDFRWGVDSAHESLPEELAKMRWPDPFTALVEADHWLAAREEAERACK